MKTLWEFNKWDKCEWREKPEVKETHEKAILMIKVQLDLNQVGREKHVKRDKLVCKNTH